MSFSSEVKEELSRISNLANKNQVKYELLGYLMTYNTSISNINYVRYATESEYNINRFSKLLNNLKINYKINFDGKSFIIMFNKKEIDIIEIKNNMIIIKENFDVDNDCLKSIVRGTFLGAGSINNPENKYHLEIIASSNINAQKILIISKKLQLNLKYLNTETKSSIYVKEGEEISKFLALIGANKAVLKFEDIRIKREMNGKINRIVNCKTANLNKVLNASVEQIEAIKKLQKDKRFNKLDENLKEIANLRLENPDIALNDLGKLLKIPIGKSGVNYRLKKIMEIANENK